MRFPRRRRRVERLSIDRRDAGDGMCAWRTWRASAAYAINGVAELHSRPAQGRRYSRDFHELWPEKFQNVTNGVTPRRFIVLSNPRPGRV